MAVNLEYYKQLVEIIKVILSVIESLKPVLIQLFQFAEDNMPNSKGGDKLKYVMECLRGLIDRSNETGPKIDAAWDIFTQMVGAFAMLQKSKGVVTPSDPAAPALKKDA